METAPRGGSHGHAQPRGFAGVIASHGIRIGTFSAIGALVFVLGTAFQWLLVAEGVGATASYTWQAVFSIELSFALNRWLTWRDRKVRLLPALTKWNLQKIALTMPNIAGYAVLVHKGMNWLVANLLMTAVFTVINYVGGDLWSFASRRRSAHAARKRGQVTLAGRPATNAPRESSVPLMSRVRHPTVSAIIPCKSNASTIRATVHALLGQDYPALIEVILVGDVGDSTWTALEDVADPRLTILEQEATPGKRDPNVKRDKGIHKSSGEILALVDSDIVMGRGWLSAAIGMLASQGGGLVAGGMRSIHDTFWGRFIDRNVLAAKTPRLPRPYLVTAQNFGRYGYKPPITANAVFTRELYDACPLDTGWAYGYEDYEWFWRLAKGGHQILFSGDLTAAHHHRRSFRRLVREYRQSAAGCARFVRVHRESPLARKRLLQAVLLPLAALTGAVLAAAAAMAGYGAVLGVLALATLAVLVVREVARSRSLEAVTYPAAALALGAVFTVRLATTLGQQAIRGDDMHSVRELRVSSPRTRTESDVLRLSWPLIAILALQAGLSLSLVWSNTAFGDEALYLIQGRLELAQWIHKIPYPAFTPDSGAPQIYPVIGALANAAGGLAAARILSLCFMLTTTLLVYLIAARLFDKPTALVGSALFAVSEPVLRLAFATFDAMACLLVTLAVWLIVQAGIRSRRGELILLSAVSLTLGNVTAFSFTIFDPIVVVLAFLIWQIQFGARAAIRYAAWLTALTILLTSLLMTILHLWNAAFLTTASRDSGLGQGISLVLRSAWSFDGLLAVAAFAGLIIAFAERDQRRFLVLVLALAAVIVPAYQAYIGTAFSMDKHMSVGNGLAAIAAGYAFSKVSLPYARRQAAGFLAVAVIAFSAITGVWYARSTFHTWANTSALLTDLRGGLSASDSKPVLINSLNGNFNVWIFDYYLMNGYGWEHWKDNSPSSIPNITAGYYSAVVLSLNASQLQDLGLPESALYGKRLLGSEILSLAGNDDLISALTESHKYRISEVVPYWTTNNANSSGLFVVWQHVTT